MDSRPRAGDDSSSDEEGGAFTRSKRERDGPPRRREPGEGAEKEKNVYEREILNAEKGPREKFADFRGRPPDTRRVKEVYEPMDNGVREVKRDKPPPWRSGGAGGNMDKLGLAFFGGGGGDAPKPKVRAPAGYVPPWSKPSTAGTSDDGASPPSSTNTSRSPSVAATRAAAVAEAKRSTRERMRSDDSLPSLTPEEREEAYRDIGEGWGRGTAPKGESPYGGKRDRYMERTAFKRGDGRDYVDDRDRWGSGAAYEVPCDGLRIAEFSHAESAPRALRALLAS